MARITKSWMVAALVLAAGIGAAACKKDEKKPEGGAATGSAAPTTAEKKAPADKVASPAVAVTKAMANGDDLSLIPSDSEIVMGLNFAQLQKSSLWKKFVEPQLVKPDFQTKLASFKDQCGFDPMTSIQSLSLGMKNVGAKGKDTPDGVVVIHGLDKAKTTACLTKMKAEIEKDGTKLTDDGGVYTLSNDGNSAAFTHVNDTTVVMVVGANGNATGVKAATAGTSALKTSPAFIDMFAKIKTGDSLWLLANGNSPMFEKAGALGVKPKAVFGSVNVTDGLTMDLRIRLNTADEATSLANMVQGQAKQAAQMFDKFDVGTEAADLKVSIALSTQKLEQLIGQVMALAGGMGGGMGGP
ncbi:MAG: hypothetical protein ACKV2T_26480 [Kofleriaceae bacterium]